MKCSSKECKNEAIVYPRISLRVKGFENHPAQSVFRLPLCFNCKSKTTVDSIIDDDGWGNICKMMHTMSKVIPHRKLTTIDFVDIDQYESIFKKSKDKSNEKL